MPCFRVCSYTHMPPYTRRRARRRRPEHPDDMAPETHAHVKRRREVCRNIGADIQLYQTEFNNTHGSHVLAHGADGVQGAVGR